MKRLVAVVAVLSLLIAAVAGAAVKSYQVTGPVLEVRDDAIVVEKGKEKWEIARDKDTKVTIQYQMKAKSIDVKGEGKEKGKK